MTTCEPGASEVFTHGFGARPSARALRATSPATISGICGCSNGSPPGIDTIGVPHSSTALKHCSGVNCAFRMCAGYWILPQPAHARLQRNNGSSISTSGYRLRPESFCFST